MVSQPKPYMEIYNLTHHDKCWLLKQDGYGIRANYGESKETATRDAAALVQKSKQPAALRIHHQNGTLEEERIFPGQIEDRQVSQPS